MSKLGFHTITLGCKLNQFDGAAIEGELERRGLHPEPNAALAAVVVVNTCTVTHRADADARKLIRRVRRENPGCRLLVTGCYAEREPEALQAAGAVDRVFGNRDKVRLASILDELRIGTPPVDDEPPAGDRGCGAALELPRALHFGERSRAFLRVQEGCRLACSYCIIPTVRGPSRSVPPEQVEAAALRLFGSGYREIVLTGVNTGDYGRDLDPRITLAALVRRLLAVAGPNRIRLNSLEPLTVTDEIVELFVEDPRLAPHLQVPLQSGSDAILRGMRRNYRQETYSEKLRCLRSAVPHMALGADVIVGFPGENEAAFRESLDFIASSPLNYLHIFSWSARPGTLAAELPGRVHEGEIRRRSAELHSLAAELSDDFRRRFVGRRLDAVVLGERKTDAKLRALTGNFIEVALEAGAAARGDLIRVRVDEVCPETVSASSDGYPAWAVPQAGSPRRSAAAGRGTLAT